MKNRYLSLFLIFSQIFSPFAFGLTQNEDAKTLAQIQSSVAIATGNLSTSTQCITSLSYSTGSYAGLATGLFVYDNSNPSYISSGTTISGLPGSCGANQIQISSTPTHVATGDTIYIGGQASQLLNDTKIWLTGITPNTQLSTALSKGLIGGGGGGKNYLSTYVSSTGSGNANPGNGNFEQGSTSGWSLANTTLGATLVPSAVASSGIPFSSSAGGSPASGNLSFSTISSGQLAGNYSASLASSASSVAGDLLISSAFNIDLADQSKVLGITFNYEVISGLSNLNFSNSSSNSFAIYIYDVTNGAWIQPLNVYNLIQTGGVGLGVASFQTTSNSTQYQLAIVNVNASSGAYSMYVDSFVVGPVAQQANLAAQAPYFTQLTSGSGTWTVPSNPAPTYCTIEAVGGGGGGAGGGYNGSYGSPGTAGTASTFGSSLLTANGGAAGLSAAVAQSGGVGGTVSVNSPAISITPLQGGGGGAGNYIQASGQQIGATGGQGGANPLAGVGSSGTVGVNASNSIANTGAGGSGGGGYGSGSTLIVTGGNGGGAGGYLKADILNPIPGATFAYSVGSGGTGGAAGTQGGIGGNAGSGVINITCNYDAATPANLVGPQTTALAPTVTVYTSGSGSYTLPNNPAPVYLEVEMVGGGGGGGGSASPASLTGTGASGSDTTFGTSLLTANGGGGGGGSISGNGGLGGSSTINSPAYGTVLNGGGGGGFVALWPASGGNTSFSGGLGGMNPLGGAGAQANDNTGLAGTPNTGAGGGGAGTDGSSGTGQFYTGAGGGAGGYIKAIISSPSSSYPYSIGSGGAGGTAGTGGNVGGAGGSGFIRVTAYYSQTVVVNQGGPATVAAKYTNTAATSLSASPVTIPFANLLYDTTNSFNTSTSTYTIPVTGKYLASFELYTAGVSNSTTQACIGYFLVTSTPEALSSSQLIASVIYGNGSSINNSLSKTRPFYFNAGDTISIQASCSNSVNLSTLTEVNTFSIERIGN